MNTLLWIAQGLLAALFLMAGTMKLFQSKENLLATGRMKWAEDLNPGVIRTIGLLELLGAIGVLLPMVLDILPIFTPLAAIGLAMTMIGAALTHMRRHEWPNVALNGVLFGLAVFVMVGRLFVESVV